MPPRAEVDAVIPFAGGTLRRHADEEACSVGWEPIELDDNDVLSPPECEPGIGLGEGGPLSIKEFGRRKAGRLPFEGAARSQIGETA
jgi:hypothetical protein